MSMKRAISLLLSMGMILTLLCECGKKAEQTSPAPSEGNLSFSWGTPKSTWFRKVAREVREDGWVYTFTYHDYYDESRDDSDLRKYNFEGMNIRYKYDEQ